MFVIMVGLLVNPSTLARSATADPGGEEHGSTLAVPRADTHRQRIICLSLRPFSFISSCLMEFLKERKEWGPE